ncbi:M20/M25/M40 family metallo-hydrolase [Sinomicrobium weinanense]|uniref:M20/M25/M40 family metallo-hydrolase n=1 Tax=Sinomicrobium weinanense TaxID=2842200 RepID=A0A926Q383_9FLAO|nr:M20/M25/M40 family metallo-hydrolase [Sinomicrobium weinanense]MBC9796644.1 M20/M25/M40 family metallo-hydrolase [Sinomicrobium weinanense]MBU3124893.1 M20/M25/M40 family metallo-hydrolase [Sinomicrobium weinanense]
MPIRNILFGITVLALSVSYGQNMSRTEKKIAKTIATNMEEQLKFTEKVININSGTMNHKGVREVGDVFRQAFDDIGFNTRWIDMPEEMSRAGHLFAEVPGKKGKKVLLIGHIDTVFEEDSPFQKLEKINDSMAHGPGANDMKGGDVIILYALKALRENGLLKDRQVIVALMGDEEFTGKPLSISRKDLIEAAKRSDVALGFEPSGGFGEATMARRGSSGWKVEVTGKQAHSADIFSKDVGAGAIFEMSRILNAFYNEVRGDKYLTFNPGAVLGGTDVTYDEVLSKGNSFGKSNVVAKKAVVDGGLRFISEEQKENARAKMREIVSQNLPGTNAEITFIDSYPAMEPTEGNKELLEKLSQVSTDLGMGPVAGVDPLEKGAADVSFVAQYVDCLDSLGAMGGGAHSPQETINLNTFEAQTKRAAILIYRLLNE